MTYAALYATYGAQVEECDEWVDAKFRGYSQHLDALEERRAYFLAKAIAPMLGFKIGN